MDMVRFIFLTALKTLGLIFLGLLAAKAVSGLSAGEAGKKLSWLQRVAYALIVGLAALNAYNLGNDIAAANYAWASQRNLAQSQFDKAYSNARRAVELRPGVTDYWEALADAKFSQHQFASMIADLPVFLALGSGRLNETFGFRLASAHFLLGQYDKVIPVTQQMIQANPAYTAPYVLEGYARLAQKKFPEAQRLFLAVLQKDPNHQAAVEGLAHTYFLAGDRARSLAVLAETSKFSFSAPARQRFEALKGLYGQ
ncbi:MAG: tetratricopeptide repeat protein [Terriglobia bacterium]